MIEIPPTLLEILRKADRVAVLTGAGISTESGIPTFRDAQTGLWASFRPEELATREAFEKNPRRVWEWYAHRRDGIQKAEPNDGHRALVEMEKRFSRFTLITQNVDGLHRRAGSRALIELHGNIARSKCFSEEIPVESWSEAAEIPPRCPHCGGFLRPDVVWFGEALPADALERAFEAASDAQVLLSVGTSALVQPAASLPLLALKNKACVVEINPEETPLSPHVNFFLKGPAGQILPALMARL